MQKFSDLWPSGTFREDSFGELVSDKLVGKHSQGISVCKNFRGNGKSCQKIRCVTPCAAKTCAVRPVFGRVAGKLGAPDPPG